MPMFDYHKAAQDAGIPPDKLKKLEELIREDFPRDDMMYELHVLGICIGIRDGLITLDEVLQPKPVAA